MLPRPSIDQSTQSVPTAPIVAPTTPPTMAWVVLTGMAENVAMRRNTAAPTSAPTMPAMYRLILLLQYPHAKHSLSATSETAVWIFVETPYPSVTAPSHSQIPARGTWGFQG